MSVFYDGNFVTVTEELGQFEYNAKFYIIWVSVVKFEVQFESQRVLFSQFIPLFILYFYANRMTRVFIHHSQKPFKIIPYNNNFQSHRK